MSSNYEIYPNQPLVEVSCQINFPFILAIQNESHLIQKEFSDYPLVLCGKRIGNAFIDEYRLEDITRTFGIAFAGDKIAFYAKKYPGHEEFIGRFIKAVKVFADRYELNNIVELTWNYVNLIPFHKKDGVIPFSEIFNISLNVPGDITNNMKNILFYFDTPFENGTISTRLEFVIDNANKEYILLDNEYAFNKEIKYDELEESARKAREITRELFEKYITKNYKEYLRGNK